MRAAYVPRPGVVEVGDFPIPEIGPGQVLVEMRHASICGSDVHKVFDGMHNPESLGLPGYPGHEGVGVVVHSRSATVAEGAIVLTVPSASCGGCFAEYQAVDDTHVIALAGGTDPRRLMLGQQLGTTVYALRKFLAGTSASPRSAAVIGAGSAGLFFLQLLRRAGCAQVIVSDLSEQRLALAREFGATTTVHAPTESVVDAVGECIGELGVDLVIEAAGYDACRADAVEIARAHGVVGMFGYSESRGLAPFPVERAFRKALTVSWSIGTQSEPGLRSFHEALALIAGGEIIVDHCLQSVFDIDQAPQALTAARAQGHGFAKIGFDFPARN